ncbi:DUF397 domain-containing protein [Streptomyces sp. OE57]|uniref:DUF397 domain-containing protein n=1 Tax=Streptomyces lacaronensis TaxID=3379885 RepID=UPI0039B7633B
MSECRWQKSSYSVEGSNCLYIAAGEREAIMLRESDRPGVILTTTRTRLRIFIRAVKAGQFDHIGEPRR